MSSVSAHGSSKTAGVLASTDRISVLPLPPRSSPQPAASRPRATLTRLNFHYTVYLLALTVGLVALLLSAPSLVPSEKSPSLLRSASWDREIAVAQRHNKAIELALRGPVHAPCDKILSEVRNLTSELAMCAHEIDFLRLHVGGDLAYRIKTAARTTTCPRVLHVPRDLYAAQRSARSVLDSIHAALASYDHTQALVRAARLDVEQALADAWEQFRTPFSQYLAPMGSDRSETEARRLTAREDWLRTLSGVLGDLEAGRNAVTLESQRYTRLAADLQVLDQKIAELLAAEYIADGPDVAPDCSIVEDWFLDAVSRVIEDQAEAHAFSEYYDAL